MQRGSYKTLLYDIACEFAYRVLLTKLVALDKDFCQYLAALIVATFVWAGEALGMPKGT